MRITSYIFFPTILAFSSYFRLPPPGPPGSTPLVHLTMRLYSKRKPTITYIITPGYFFFKLGDTGHLYRRHAIPLLGDKKQNRSERVAREYYFPVTLVDRRKDTVNQHLRYAPGYIIYTTNRQPLECFRR